MKLPIAIITLISAFLFRPAHAAVPSAASGPPQPGASAAGNSFNPIFSAGGRHLAFVSHANNLVTNDDLGLSLDVFVRDLVNSNTILVSVSTSGIGGANVDANYPSISSNGQFVAFASRASNLVVGDTNDASDVFVRDLVTGTTTLVSVENYGSGDPNPSLNIPLSGHPIISQNGRWVFFESRSTNFGVPDFNNATDVFGRDIQTGEMRAVSIGMNGVETAQGTSTLAAVSADGRYVAFISTATNIAASGTSTAGDLYLRDMAASPLLCLSKRVGALVPGPYRVVNAALSLDGRYVAFVTLGATGSAVFRHDVVADVTTLISTAVTNTANGIQISADGRFVLFEELSGGIAGVRLWDAQSGITNIVGCTPESETRNPSMTPDASRIAFLSCSNIYIWSQGTYILVTASSDAERPLAADSPFISPMISSDGQSIAFHTISSELVSNDLNGASDIFMHNTSGETTELITRAASSRPASTALAHSFLGLNSISADGRFIVTLRYDDPSAYRDTNGWPDVFITDRQAGVVKALSIDTNLYSTDGGTSTATNTVPNTNAYFASMISADGSTVAALRWRSPGVQNPFQPAYELVVARSSNGVFGSGMTLVSRDFNGQPAGADSATLSGDGQLVAFSTPWPQVMSPNDNSDNNAVDDVFVRYYGLQITTNYYMTNYSYSPRTFLVSVSTNGYESGNGVSTNAVISSKGRWLAFETKANNLVANTPSAYPALQLAVADLGTNRTTTNYLRSIPKRLASYAISFQEFQWVDAQDTNVSHTNLNAVLEPITTDVADARFSANQRYVFYTLTNRTVWRHDLTTVHTNITFVRYTNTFGMVVANNVVPGAANVLVCTNCNNASASADGNVAAYERVRGGNVVDLFTVDLRDRSEALVSANASGALANGTSTSPLISGDGRYVAFQSKASDLIANDSNGAGDIFVRDRMLGVTMLVSANAQGLPGNGPSSRPVIAADGRTVVFQSFANDLVGGDYNDKRDVFVLTLGGADTDGDGMDDDWEVAYFGNLSRNGSGDFDSDGASDLAEFLAGTDPTNTGSVFRVLTIAPAGGGSQRLIWSGNPSRSYRAEFKDDVSATNWTAVSGTISWNGSTASLTDFTAINSAHRYYRVVRLP